MTKPLDISSRATGPAKVLSNFTAHPFTIDEVTCGSMEGFLQSLKFADLEQAALVAGTDGYTAKKMGEFADPWWETQTLYWKGEAMERGGRKYKRLLARAFDALFEQNSTFVEALLQTGFVELAHYMGKDDQTKTILTETEFMIQLYRLRSRLHAIVYPEVIVG